MLSCNGCKNRNTHKCISCVGWNRYESNTLINPVLSMGIDKEMKMLAKAALNGIFGVESAERKIDMRIKKAIFNDPATVVLWKDGTKTIVKSGENDIYDPEKGLAMAIAKKALGNQGNYYEVFKKWLPEDPIEKIKKDIKELENAVDKKIGDKYKSFDKVNWLSVKEVADDLETTEKYIRKQIKDGLIPSAKKVGGKWKIPCLFLDDHIEIIIA